jgi:glutamine amidotransferase PdxT
MSSQERNAYGRQVLTLNKKNNVQFKQHPQQRNK